MGLQLGPAYVALNIGAANPADRIILTPDSQMSDLTLTLNEPTTDLMTQASTTAADTSITGLDVSAAFSLAETDNLDLFSLIYHGATKEEDPDNPGSFVVSVAQRAGCRVDKYAAIVVAASCDGPTTDPAGWFFMPYAGFFTQDTSLVFGKETQQELAVTLRAFPPPPGNIFFGKKLVRGNYRKFDASLPTVAQLFSGATIAPPTGVNATSPSAGQLQATWTAPTTPGGTITGYVAQYALDGTTNWTGSQTLGANTTTATWSVPAGSYIVRVRTVANNGQSAFAVDSTPATVA